MIRPRPLSVGVFALALGLTGGLTWATLAVRARSEERTLQQQVQQTAAAVAAQVPTVQAQLADAAEVANDTGANAAIFARFNAPKIMARGPFAGMSLWRIRAGHVRRLASIGAAPALLASPTVHAFFESLRPSPHLFVTGLLAHGSRLGYAEVPPGERSGLAVYAERRVPGARRVRSDVASPFGDLRLALYLGSVAPAHLLEETAAIPVGAPTASATVPFGDRSLTLVGAATRTLVAGLSAVLPWIVLGVGTALACAGGLATESMVRRRLLAERYAAENERLYIEQRNLANEFQQALLPKIPRIEGLTIISRYVAGAPEIDVGGDWYDVIEMAPGHCVFVVGDVAGRGLAAATTMASLRYAVRAYVAQGDPIEDVLGKLGDLVSIEADGRFATMLLGEIHLAERRVRLLSAGHFLPLLVTEGKASYVDGALQPPVGVRPRRPAEVTSFVVDGPAWLVAFSDGLVERRGEVIDVGLERLRRAAEVTSVESLAETVTTETAGSPLSDDTVLLAIRW